MRKKKIFIIFLSFLPTIVGKSTQVDIFLRQLKKEIYKNK